MSWYLWPVVVALWSGTGVTAVFLLLHRRGFRERIWYLIGAILGPFMIPMAAERSRRHSGIVEGQATGPATGTPRRDGMTLLVGVDGSPEAERAIADAARLAGPGTGRILLATVIGVDEAESADDDARERARRLLAEAAARLPADGPPSETRILCGSPTTALAELAAEESADVVVVGRRGRGLSRALLGSVAERLGHECPVPVLLAGPAGDRARTEAPR